MCAVSYERCQTETIEADCHINQSREIFVDHLNGRMFNGYTDRACICSIILKEIRLFEFSSPTKLTTARKEAAVKLITMIKHFYTFTYSKGLPFPSPSMTNRLQCLPYTTRLGLHFWINHTLWNEIGKNSRSVIYNLFFCATLIMMVDVD